LAKRYWYEKTRRACARGGKLLGAGSGGLMIFTVPIERHENIRHALADLREVKLRFEHQGSLIIFVHR
jgi:D-glycero-alpha-D-manno-heptose-7-phosphate kinase